jgi:hypothetical protein
MTVIEALRAIDRPIVMASELAPIFGITADAMKSRLDTAHARDGLTRFKMPWNNQAKFTWTYSVDDVIAAVESGTSALTPRKASPKPPVSGVTERIERKLDAILRIHGINPEEV